MAMKPAPTGIWDRGTSPASAVRLIPESTPGLSGGGDYRTVLAGQVVQTRWRDEQPTDSTQYVDPVSGKRATMDAWAAEPEYDSKLVYRPFAGFAAAPWAKAGGFEYANTNASGGFTVFKYWQAGAVDRYRSWMEHIAAKVEADANILAVVASMVMVNYPEIGLHQIGANGSVDQATNIAAYMADFGSDQADVADFIDAELVAFEAMCEAHKELFPTTWTMIAFSPYETWDLTEPSNSQRVFDDTVTAEFIAIARDVLGPKAMLGNYALRAPDNGATEFHAQMWTDLQAAGGPLIAQTATQSAICGTGGPTQDPENPTFERGYCYPMALQRGVKYGVSYVELDGESTARYAEAGPASFTDHNDVVQSGLTDTVKYRLSTPGLNGWGFYAQPLTYWDRQIRRNPAAPFVRTGYKPTTPVVVVPIPDPEPDPEPVAPAAPRFMALRQVPGGAPVSDSQAYAELRSTAVQSEITDALAIHPDTAFSHRVPWRQIENDFAFPDEARLLAPGRDYALRILAGRYSVPAALLGPTITVQGFTVPAPYGPGGTINTVFEAQYRLMVRACVAYALSHGDKILHLPWYGAMWAELYRGPEVQDNAAAWLTAHTRLIDIAHEEAHELIPVTFAMSGHGPLIEQIGQLTQYIEDLYGPDSGWVHVLATGLDDLGYWGVPVDDLTSEAAKSNAVFTKNVKRGLQAIQPWGVPQFPTPPDWHDMWDLVWNLHTNYPGGPAVEWVELYTGYSLLSQSQRDALAVFVTAWVAEAALPADPVPDPEPEPDPEVDPPGGYGSSQSTTMTLGPWSCVVRYPTLNGQPATNKSHPVVIALHGQQGTGTQTMNIFAHMVLKGCVLIAPSMGSTFDPDGRWPLVLQMIDDIEGLTDFAVELDLTRLGVCGSSMGGMMALTNFTVAGHDARIKSVFTRIAATRIFAGGQTVVAGPFDWDNGTPLVMINGTADTTVPIGFARDNYDDAVNPKGLIELSGIGHSLLVGSSQILQQTAEFWLSTFIKDVDTKAAYEAIVATDPIAAFYTGSPDWA